MIRFVNTAPGLTSGQSAEVQFANGSKAMVYASNGDAGEAVLRLGLTSGDRGRPVLLVFGGADDLTGAAFERAAETLGPAIAAATRATGACVIDGGTSSGVMRITGQARAQHPGAIKTLVGVAPAGLITFPGGAEGADLVPLQDDHSHFVLAASDKWGGETGLMLDVAEAIAGEAPVVVTLAGGGPIAGKEVLEASRRGWPVFALTGTGGLADRIAYRRSGHQPAAGSDAVEDADMRAILTNGDLRLVSDVRPAQLARQLAWELQDEPVLKDAWQKFSTYDNLAGRLRRTFTRTQGTILVLGVTATLLALIHNEAGGSALHWTVVAVPILASVLIALASRSAAGQRWVMLRAAAEAIKTEIYRYRTTGRAYNTTASGSPQVTRQQALAARIGAVDAKLMQTQASSGPLTPYRGPLPPPMYGAASDDDGLSPLDAETYLSIRVGDQLSYYHGKIRSLSRNRAALQILAIASGGAGAVLAAAGLEVWVGLTSGAAAAALAYLGYLQVDNSIVSYNQAASSLANLQSGWLARSSQQRTRAALNELVQESESVLTTELSGWVQQMNETLRELAASQAKAAAQLERGEAPASGERDDRSQGTNDELP